MNTADQCISASLKLPFIYFTWKIKGIIVSKNFSWQMFSSVTKADDELSQGFWLNFSIIIST